MSSRSFLAPIILVITSMTALLAAGVARAQDYSTIPPPLQVDTPGAPVPAPGPGFGGPSSSYSGPPLGAPIVGPPVSAPPYYGPPPALPPYGLAPPPPTALVLEPIEPGRFWIQSDYLLWWTKNSPLPAPLVTVGSSSDSIPGALGQPGTRVIAGAETVDLSPTSGWRLDTGVWVDPERRFGVQAVFFILGRSTAGFSAVSDDNGFPVIARPVIDARNGTETSYVDSMPGALAGGVSIFNSSEFLGVELNGLMRLYQSGNVRVDGLFGFRYMNLTESLEIDDALQPLVNNYLTFLGQPVDPSGFVSDFDKFKTINNFYGGQFGAKVTWNAGRWTFDATPKLALGATTEKTSIRGGTTLFGGDGSVTSAEGGVLATSANIGDYSQTRFAVVPEIDLNVAFHFTPTFAIRAGYSFLYWSNVVRPGDQVNRTVSPNLIPTDVDYGTPGPNQPSNQFHTASYWAQGLNLGLDFHF